MTLILQKFIRTSPSTIKSRPRLSVVTLAVIDAHGIGGVVKVHQSISTKNKVKLPRMSIVSYCSTINQRSSDGHGGRTISGIFYDR